MRQKTLKLFIMVVGMLLPTTWCGAFIINSIDGVKPITIIEGTVQGTPRTNSIQATINGHYLTVVFTENLGNVTVEVSKVSGGETQIESTPTPNGVNFYIYDTGSYIVTFNLSNGDVYYGEFDVTD